ncbi:LysM peptidoglycan-binding domain-containing protein [Robiginitalea sp. SC105]|uniref:LysM peptidoglycan-binding domain-containing protein n=1 Tax=Robiginitalea sp. SC105 TaxID=2762332 RepID=UPI00163A2454|nr:LysM peptidoglycan-binding domain-containing protein [Robiginitalea sp. SC105]MBC2840160.1 LysM peptidoglycan-binding domain-containing protein [Robiginitalea sp. SC105]
MNVVLKYLLLLLCCLAIGCKAKAQQFSTHAVKRGETLYSIASEYQVSPQDLLKYNKEVDPDGSLRPNTILVIPSSGNNTLANRPAVGSAQDSTARAPQVTFLTHRVRRKETLFSITQRYRVSEEELKRYNPDLYSRSLQKGMVLRVPRFSEAYREAEELEELLDTYMVQPKETRWSIAHKFGITIDSLLQLNPELPSSTSYLAEGQELRVPRLAGSGIEEQESEVYRSYTVPPKKTLYSLSQEFGISREEIIRLNPEILERGNLQEGMRLRLPEKKADTSAVNASNFIFYEVKPKQTEFSLTRKLGIGWPELRALNPDLATGLKAGMVLKLPRDRAEGLEVKNALVLDEFNLRDSINTANRPRLLVLFPFRLDRLDLQDEEKTRERIRNNNALKYSLGLYSGLLVALDSVADMGISVDVRTFDTQLSADRVRNMLLSEDLGNVSAIIGPLEPRSIQEVAARASDLGVPVIAPVPINEDFPLQNIFYTYTDEAELRRRMLGYMKQQVTDQNILIISDQANREVESQILQAFPGAELVPLKEEEKNVSLDREAFMEALSQEKENWVFVETNDFKIASSVSSILNSANTEETRVRMFSTNRSRAFENEVISATHLSNLKFTFPSVYRSAATSSFTRRYRQRFGGEPDRYAVRGFDLGMDLLLRLAYKLDLFEAADQIGATRYTGNTFNYIKKLQSGYFNTASYILMYDGLRIVEIQGP